MIMFKKPFVIAVGSLVIATTGQAFAAKTMPNGHVLFAPSPSNQSVNHSAPATVKPTGTVRFKDSNGVSHGSSQ